MNQILESDTALAEVMDTRAGKLQAKNLNPLFRQILELRKQHIQRPARQPQADRLQTQG